MSAGGAGAGGSRVSIPNNVKEMIKTIKEMVGNHSDDEIHAMLKECSMDPNETAQKLLYLDPFHEVKRRRDKRKEVKENMNSRESLDSRWRHGTQGRGGRSGRGNFSSRYTNDLGDGRNKNATKENGVKQGTERGVMPSSLVASQGTESEQLVSLSSSNCEGNGLNNVAHGHAPGPHSSVIPQKKSQLDPDNLESAHLSSQPPVAKPTHSDVEVQNEQPTPTSDQSASPVSVLGVYSSTSDPVLVPSLDSRIPGTVGTIKREVGSQRFAESNSFAEGENGFTETQDINNNSQVNNAVTVELNKQDLSSSTNEKASTDSVSSFIHGKMPSKSQLFERSQCSESSHSSSSSTHGTSNSRPSSNYGNRPQQLTGSQKVGSSKEWKPKPTNPISVPASAVVGMCESGPITVKVGTHSLPRLSTSVSEESTSKLQEKLEELHTSHNQHVIIPNHLQVPESEKTGLSFGSFGVNFEVKRCCNNDHDTEKSATPLSESSQEPEETTEEPLSSNQIGSSPTRERDYSDNLPSSKNVPDTVSHVEADVSSSAAHEYDQSKSEAVTPTGGPLFSVVHTAPNYNIGLMPHILGTQFAPFDTSESQAREASRLQSFVVQQPFDPSNYYPHLYRPTGDGDGHFSPFIAPGSSTKFNGNIAAQSGQPQESGNSVVLSTAGPTPLATQAVGVMQSSLAVTQQPVPIFRQPSGVHLPHYPPNYIPYSQYFSPIYLPPQTIHHYLANPTFPQQPPTGSVYPPPGAAATTGVKYSLSQYKSVANTGNSTHVGIPSGYAHYGSSQTVYSPSPVTTTTNSNGNEDLPTSQYKENNVYIAGQQSEGSAVWIPAPGRDISGLSASSFYSLSPQGQHVAFTPTQAGHGAFTGIYHPSQTMAATTVHPLLQQSQSHGGPVEMAGTPSGGFQQTQRAPVNWTNNY